MQISGPFHKSPAETAEMPETPQCQANPAEKAKKTKELSNSAQKMIVLAILSQSTDGVPHRGVYQKSLR